MMFLEILERGEYEILFRYRNNDGAAYVCEGKVQFPEIVEEGLELESSTASEVQKQLQQWLDKQKEEV